MGGLQLRRAVCRVAAEVSGPPAGRRRCGRWTGRAARFPAVGWWPRGPRGPPARLRVRPCALAAGPVTRFLSLTEFRDSPCVTVFWACGGSSSVTEQAGATSSGLRAAAGSLAVAGTPLRATIPCGPRPGRPCWRGPATERAPPGPRAAAHVGKAAAAPADLGRWLYAGQGCARKRRWGGRGRLPRSSPPLTALRPSSPSPPTPAVETGSAQTFFLYK